MSALEERAAPQTASVAPYPSPVQAWYMVGVLMVFYVFSFIDRQIIALLVGPMKRDLGISDLQVGLLQGAAFALLYTFLGVPIGRLADRTSRKTIIAVGVVTWSVMASLCGLARNWTQLFLARIGVGVGEAALSPAAYSMITDSFPPEKRGAAFGIYNSGIPIGSGIALLVGGLVVGAVSTAGDTYTLPFIGEVRAWQFVFIITGAPGILLPLLLLGVREPARRGLMVREGSKQVVPISEVFGYVWTHRQFYFRHMFALALLSMVGYGVGAWLPESPIRGYGITAAQIGTIVGIATLSCGTLGVFIAGKYSDALTKRGLVDAPVFVALVAAIAIGVTSVLPPIMPTVPLVWVALVVGALPFQAYTSMGPLAIAQVTPNQMRAQVAAMYLFVVNMLGLGVGPVIIPLVNRIVFDDVPAMMRFSLAIVVAVGCLGSALLLWSERGHFRARVEASKAWV